MPNAPTIVAAPGQTTLHAHNEPPLFDAAKVEDDQEYEVTLSKTARHSEVRFQPNHHHRMTGAFVKLLADDPLNEGAIVGAKLIQAQEPGKK